MTMICRTYILLGLLFSTSYGLAQKRYLSLELEKQHKPILSIEKWYKDSLDVLKSLRKEQVDLHKKGFLAASIDQIEWLKDTAKAKFHIGNQYSWAVLSFEPQEELLVKKVSYKEKYFNDKPVRLKEVVELEEDILKYAENNGYPFAMVELDSIVANHGELSAKVKYKPGPKIKIDSLEILGTSKVKKSFIQSYIRINDGENFSQQKMNDANHLLKNISAIKVKSPPEAVFYNNKSVIQLYLDQRKNNQFYGIVGLLPNEGTEGGVLFTGEIKLNLTNVFNSAKVITGEWKSFNPLSQYLDLNYEHPNFLHTNIDISLGLNLLKEDTTFLNVERAFALRYNFGKRGSISLITRYKTGRLLSTDQYSIFTPPEFLDTDYLSYGFRYFKSTLDDQFQPKKGVLFSIESMVGNKRIKKNLNLEDALYDDVEENTLQLNIKLNLEQYHKLGRLTVLANKFRLASIQNKNILLNEAYRLGGFQTLRGFLENEFYTTSYLLSNLEYRVFTDEYSYVFLLYDQALIVRDAGTGYYEDYPLGLGAGVNLLTPAGYLTFIYSLGAAKNQHFSFSQSKIHFGLVSIF